MVNRKIIFKNILAIKSLIYKKENWEKDHWARNKKGDLCDPISPNAVSFCLWGAAKHLQVSHEIHDVLKKNAYNKFKRSLIGINNQGHDKAIEFLDFMLKKYNPSSYKNKFLSLFGI